MKRSSKIKVSDIRRAIRDIRKLDVDLRKLGTRATPDIVGFFGELVAWKELKSKFGWRGFRVQFGSGQSKADIVLVKRDRKINIEVKTSRLKKEQPGLVYGFAINIKKCIHPKHPKVTYSHPKKGKITGGFCYFDYLLLVTLLDDLKDPKFYVFPRKFLETNEKLLRNKSKRFSSGSHRVIFVEKPNKKDQKEITSLDRRLTKNKRKYQNAWHLIKP
ncbi:hypothetical protein HY406_01805 [Candidatus Giovannonibacteria bacterium]|nr:hypothetical protein [Candidatus Giovannonibacteria bacterium]